MRVAIVVSVAVHAGLVAWVATHPLDLEPPTRAAAPVVTIEPAPAIPVEIQLVPLPPDTRVAAIDTRVAASDPRAPTRARTAASGRDPAATKPGREPTPNPTSAPAKPSLLAMRGAKPAPVVGVSSDFVDQFLARSKPLPPIPDLPGARIDAELRDAEEAKRHCHTDCAGVWAAAADARARRRQVELVAQRDGTHVIDKETFAAKVDRDGKIHIADKPNVRPDGMGIKFDVNDALMRRYVGDPYASAKLKMMDRTRDQRVAIGKEYRREVLSHAGEYMRINLQRFWASTTDLAKRKQGLFDLWDECAETGSAELVAGGADARRVLTAWIQLKLVGPSRYTEAELARLNGQRRSKAVFAPYAAPPPPATTIPE
jgi:hypothetical protein